MGEASALGAASAAGDVEVASKLEAIAGLDLSCGVVADDEDGIVDEVPPHPDSAIAVGTAMTDMSRVKFMC